MATLSSALTVKEPKAHRGGTGTPPRFPGGDGDGRGGEGYPNYGERLRRYRLGLAVGIAPIIMLFVAFTSAYIVRQGLASWDNATNSYVNDWLPVSLPTLLLSINTVILLVSSLTMEFARRQAARRAALAPITSIPGIADDEATGIPWLTVTVVLGVGFLVGQFMAWRMLESRGYYLATSPSSSFVYLLTGMHALHLAGGVLALIYSALAVAWLKKPVEVKRIVVDVTAWYWHFMALLWLYVFALLELAR
jgi:cytochrome c oxidase subunit 3